ncbi:MAG: hypothetical protein BRD23_07935 [Halobacteriales archaeon SW_9_67_25]|jgi:hypothetical protein|nr:MAG: hypothetical protein BRD23_07935 [Halobacteriales archaeon SW_9_67_25]
MTDREVTVRVDEVTYEEWQTVAESEEEYDGVEDLVRTAVEREMAGDHDGDLTMGELLERLRNPYD